MTAISVSERLLEMAAFYTWLDFTLTENRLLNIARLNSVGQQGICLGFRHNKTRRIAADFQAQTPRRQEITAPQCLPRC